MTANIHPKPSSVAVVVNHDLTQLQALSSLLAEQGLEVQAFESATAALEAMSRAVPPALIVTELYMPGLDGWRFCRLLRSSEYASFNRIPILVVSATFSGEGTSRITTDLGANAFLSSPIDRQEFEEQVRKLLKGEQPQKFLRLLIVEDDDAQAELLKEVFEAHGYRADIAFTGRDAETKVKTQAYDVVVLDHHLPDIQGDELLLRLKPLWQDTVYLAMTGDPRPKLALEWTQLGAAAFVSKPFAPHYLIELCVKARRERDLIRVADRLEVRAREFRQSEEQHRHLLQHLQAGVVVHAPDTSILLANQEASRLLGLPLDQMQGKVATDPAWQLVHDDGSRMAAHEYPVMQVLASLRPVTNLVVGVDRPGGGERTWALVNAFPESDEQQQLRQVVVTFVDITERKRAEAALEVERLQFRHLFEQSPVATWLEDLTAVGLWMQHLRDQGVVDLRAFLQEQPDQLRHAASLIRVVDMNLAAVAQNAAQSKQHLLENLPQLFEAQTYQDFLAELDAIWQGQDSIEFESRGRRLDGRSLVRILRLSIPTRGGRLDLSRVVVTGTDITERRQSEEAIRQVRADLEKAQSVAHIGSWISRSPEQGTLIWSAEAHRIFGAEPSEFDGRVESFLKYVHPEDRTRVVALAEAAWRGEQPYNLDHRIVRPDGCVRWVHEQADIERDASGQPVRMIGVVRDVTERRQAEEERERLQAQLTQAQKMESVGRLAGGVAHDFNNMLTVIQGNAALAMQDLPPDSPLRENLEEIQKCTERSTDLTRQLLAFARRQTIAPKVLDLNATVEKMLKMLQRLIGENIHLAWLPAADLWPVKIDSSQVDQVLANLCVNARDAVGSVGEITLETGNFTFDEAYCATHTGFVPGDFVLLAVGDNGCGMEKEVLAHLFEPFFTTKGVGKGTGLGLATVYGIVKQNDGFINVHSEQGQGTTIKAYLPRHVGKTGQNPIDSAAQPIRRGHETVLLVEDEPAILRMGAQILKNLGYAVLAAATPGEAIHLAREQRGEIHLLMTDVIMPEMNGRDLAEQLRGLYPAIKRLYMSGYTADVIAHHGVLDEGIHFIQKPFSLEDLAEKVREALDD